MIEIAISVAVGILLERLIASWPRLTALRLSTHERDRGRGRRRM